MGGELPVDCEVGQWEEWGICRWAQHLKGLERQGNRCDGERTRFRHILRRAPLAKGSAVGGKAMPRTAGGSATR